MDTDLKTKAGIVHIVIIWRVMKMPRKVKYILQVFDKNNKIVHQDIFTSKYMLYQAKHVWDARGYKTHISKTTFGDY